MPREFIANVDTANEEIERLDSQIGTLTSQLETANAAAVAARESFGQAEADFLEAVEARDKSIKDLEAVNVKLAETQKLLDEANRNVVKVAAASGGSPIKDLSPEESDKRADQSSGLTGTARLAAAIEANAKR